MRDGEGFGILLPRKRGIFFTCGGLCETEADPKPHCIGEKMTYATELVCRNCGKTFPLEARSVCDVCGSPLDVNYNYEALSKEFTKKSLQKREPSMWRYAELLPASLPEGGSRWTGFTPLVRAKNLGKALGLDRLYLKNDTVNYPTLSFKDRVVSVSLAKALDFGYRVVGCASTGNLANAVAAQAAAAGLESVVLVPEDLEPVKILASAVYKPRVIKVRGLFDSIARLCKEISRQKDDWTFLNIDLRPYYAEGSKTMGYEILEQLNWQVPQNVVVPMAGGSLLSKIYKSFDEMVRLGWIQANKARFFGAQPTGCSPIVTAVKENLTEIRPVLQPQTVAKSLAIGNPLGGFNAVKTIRRSGGWAEEVTDEEVIAGIQLLAETEGIFTETAGGVTVGVLKKLVEQGRIHSDELTVAAITGQGLKTIEVLPESDYPMPTIQADYSDFEKILH